MGIELIDLLEETTPAGVRFARSRGVRIVKSVKAEALRRNLRDGIHCVAQQLPERLRAVGSGKPATDADDCNRVVCCLPLCVDRRGWLRGLQWTLQMPRK